MMAADTRERMLERSAILTRDGQGMPERLAADRTTTARRVQVLSLE
jgi:hypothetical protein